MSSKFSWVGNNIVIRYSNAITLNDVENINDTIFSDERFDNMRFQFNIFEETAFFSMSEIDFQKMMYVEKASTLSNKNKMYHALVLLNKEETLFQSCIDYQNFIQKHGWEALIFSNKEEAYKWILEKVKLPQEQQTEFQNLIQG